jgi:glycerol uptake facilitator-like aquaporin
MAMERKRIPNWLWALVGVATVALVLFVLWWGPWLFTRYPHQGLTSEQKLKAVNDVRTTLVQAVGGLALASGAIVTYRTFRHTRAMDRARQVTETYTKAVEQLGHDEAPVRLGALYSLVSLAQDNPPRRQTVVDVLCAYLRMPYTPPQ